MPATIEITTSRPARANEPTTISPSASLGRSNFTQVITSPGFIDGRGIAPFTVAVGEGAGAGDGVGLGAALEAGVAVP